MWVICLERGANCLHMVQLKPLHSQTPSSLASFKSRLFLPFWCRPTQVVLERRLLNWCSIQLYIVQYVVSYWRVNQNDRGQGWMEKVRPWCGLPLDRGRLKNRTEQCLGKGIVLCGIPHEECRRGYSSLFCRPWAHRWLDHWSINLWNACVSSWILFTACLHKLRCQIWFCSWPDRNWWHITAKWEDCIIIYSHASIDMDSEPLDGYITEVCDTWLVTYYYLPSPGAFGICMWTTCLRLLPESGMARTQTRDLLSRESNTLTTASPGHAY